MEVHFYTSVQLSFRFGGGLMLRLEMVDDCSAPLYFAAALPAGGYLIFERIADAAAGVRAVYEAITAVDDLDPNLSVEQFNPAPKPGADILAIFLNREIAASCAGQTGERPHAG